MTLSFLKHDAVSAGPRQPNASLSWAGIIAGVFAAIALQLLFNLLGVGIGAQLN